MQNAPNPFDWRWLIVPGVVAVTGGVTAVISRRTASTAPLRLPDVPLPPPESHSDIHVGHLEAPPPELVMDERPLCGSSDQLSNPDGDEPAEACLPPSEFAPKGLEGIPMAKGEPQLWPVETDHQWGYQPSYYTAKGKFRGRWGRHFGAKRSRDDGPDQRHAGNDLAGDEGDLVLAVEPGTIMATLPFYKGTWAMYVLTDSGLVLNYGEIDKNSWREFDRSPGDRILPGDPLARIGHHKMLHFETYAAEPDLDQQVKKIRFGHYRWTGDNAAVPKGLLDPTRYLVKAQLANAMGRTEPPVS